MPPQGENLLLSPRPAKQHRCHTAFRPQMRFKLSPTICPDYVSFSICFTICIKTSNALTCASGSLHLEELLSPILSTRLCSSNSDPSGDQHEVRKRQQGMENSYCFRPSCFSEHKTRLHLNTERVAIDASPRQSDVNHGCTGRVCAGRGVLKVPHTAFISLKIAHSSTNFSGKD